MSGDGSLPANASLPEWPNNADGYELVTRIGHGAFAEVHKARIKEGKHDGTEVAIKIMELEESADSSLEEIRRELQMMRMCRHENIIVYYIAFPARRQMWLVMPLLAGGSCANVMRARASQGGFEDEGVIAYILQETAKAIKYLHDQMQIHRDLKAGNILLSLEGKVYLSDFGVAAPLRDDKKRITFVGTPCWMAPEVLEQAGYDYKADIWSYGITAIELAYGEAPYQRLHPLKVMKIIIEKDPPRLSGRKSSALFVELIEACLQKDPKKRPKMEKVFEDHRRFFAKANEGPLVETLRSLPPLEKRIQAKPPMAANPWPEGSPKDISAASDMRKSWDFKIDGDDDDTLEDFGLAEVEETAGG
mmetsp:Transcript_159090/g.296392  ORF Transcript_159090/g.296392 Transcript_159090/m.296392 type:complete len:362 (-) Transcript_159090:202-1287(-)